MKSHKCSMLLNIYMTLFYVTMWRKNEQSTKSQTFRFYITYKCINLSKTRY